MSTWVHPWFLVGSMLLIYWVFCVVLITCLYVLSPCCDVHYDFRIKTMLGSSWPLVVCRMSCLCYLCLFTSSGVQHMLCCVLGFSFSSCVPCVASFLRHASPVLLVFFVMWPLCCQFLWIVLFWLPHWYSLTFILQKHSSHTCFFCPISHHPLWSTGNSQINLMLF